MELLSSDFYLICILSFNKPTACRFLSYIVDMMPSSKPWSYFKAGFQTTYFDRHAAVNINTENYSSRTICKSSCT